MMEYIEKDIILPKLQLPNPCSVRVKIDEKNVCLYVGPRDWQWDRESGKFVGAGTCRIGAAVQKKEESGGTAFNTGSLQSLKIAFIGGYVAGSRVFNADTCDIAFSRWLKKQ